MPIHVISNKAAARLKIGEGKFNIKYVSRMSAFRPPKEVLEEYRDMLRRSEERKSPELFKFIDSPYGGTYRYLLNKGSIPMLRKLYEESVDGDVYLVNELEMPITDVMLDIIKTMSGVWKRG